MSAVLADTGPLYAATVVSDQYHQRAQQEATRLGSGTEVIIAYPILMETYGLLLRRLTPSFCHSWLTQMRERADLITPTTKDYATAMERVQRYPDQDVSLFDALLAVLSKRFATPVWTFDHHFDVLRVDVWR